jgi:ABC-type dipeptide/oligopeptide/nickel transport system ATPase component
VALVGESGSGKSLTALAALNLLLYNTLITCDEMVLQGHNLLPLTEKDWCKNVAVVALIIFPRLIASLNPVMTIGAQIMEVLTQHFELPKKKSKNAP